MRIAAALALAILVAGCARTPVERRDVDGVDCVIAQNDLGKVRAISCDWGER